MKHNIESSYEYPAGIALSRFLEGLSRGRIVSSRCSECGWAVVPPRAFCVKCFSPKMEFVEISGDGYVETFTRSIVEVDGSRAGSSISWIFVKFKGIDGGLLHRLGGSSEPFRGMRVRPVFRKERARSILDIDHFAPAE